MEKNTPYIKKFDDEGKLLNPIKGSYINTLPNRHERRKKPVRFHGESKNFHLTVIENNKYKRVKQTIIDKKTGKKKIIEHYLLIPN